MAGQYTLTKSGLHRHKASHLPGAQDVTDLEARLQAARQEDQWHGTQLWWNARAVMRAMQGWDQVRSPQAWQAVTVSGTVTDEPDGSVVNSAAYTVADEYGQIEPSGNLSLEADGSYALSVPLQASRNGRDRDGRRYTIVVSATDHAGNSGVASAIVTVPPGPSGDLEGGGGRGRR
jgi:hypothetical protein